MAITKRTRYEVLRRDEHRCRYCGASAPDVKLTVDHVTPVALGGTDDPSNLVAACKDCNAGKASTNPDASLVADVRDDAIRYAELTRQAYEVLVEQIDERTDYIDAFLSVWDDPLPSDYRSTLGRWHRMGVPIQLVYEAVEIAAGNRTVYANRRFQYMCGVVWNQVRSITEEVDQKAALDGAWMTSEAQDQMWFSAYDKGEQAGIEWITHKHSSHIGGGLVLAAHVDNRVDTLPDFIRGVA